MLSVLAAILLIVDIGLGIYYSNLTDGQRIVNDINTEVAKLQQAYKTAITTKFELKKELANQASLQRLTEWEFDHQKSQSEDYQRQINKIQSYITVLKSFMPLLKEGCRQCSPGWSYMNSMCYYIPFSDDIPRRSWDEGRENCRNLGADIVTINSKEKQLAISNLISNTRDPSRHYVQSGFWIAARDVDEEGVWRWLDGTRLTKGYWASGEPNNQGNEDCAAVYPQDNPFKNWNDAPCNHHLKWICEKAPGFARFT